MRLLILLVLIALVAFAIYVAVDAARRRALAASAWRVDTFNRPDGTTVVAVRRSGSGERVVKELPPGMDAVEFESELRLALDDAERMRATLNREPPGGSRRRLGP